MKHFLKLAAGQLGGLLVLVAGFVVCGLILHYVANFAGRFHEWISLGLALLMLVQSGFALLAIIPRCRRLAAQWIYTLSFLFGLSLWLRSLMVAYSLWGLVAVIVGLLMVGVGVLPVAILACACKGLWWLCFEFIGLTLWLVVSRFFAGWCGASAEHRELMLDEFPP